MEKIAEYFQNNQGDFGYVMIVVSLFIIFGAYKDWDWIVAPGGGMGTFNRTWMANNFGRKGVRILIYIVAGICAFIGVLWVALYKVK
jgi:hypothetical protein